MGVCKFCGQVSAKKCENKESATFCGAKLAELRQQLREARALLRAAVDAKGIVEDLFGEGCADVGFTPVSPEIRAALDAVIDLIAKGDITVLHLQVPGVCKIVLRRCGRQIKVERSEGKKVEQIAGEK